MTAFDLIREKPIQQESKEPVFEIESFEQLFDIIGQNREKDSIVILPKFIKIFKDNDEYKAAKWDWNFKLQKDIEYNQFVKLLTAKHFFKVHTIWENGYETGTYRVQWRNYSLWIAYDENDTPQYGTVENSGSDTMPYYSDEAKQYRGYRWVKVRF